MKRVGIFPGTFDPLTLAHEDIIARAAKWFDTLWVAVAPNEPKNPMLPLAERVALAEDVLSHHAHVKVCVLERLLVDCAREKGAQTIVRSARHSIDFNKEFQLAAANTKLDDALETILLMPKLTFMGISSTIVREIALLGGDISAFVSPKVLAFLNQR